MPKFCCQNDCIGFCWRHIKLEVTWFFITCFTPWNKTDIIKTFISLWTILVWLTLDFAWFINTLVSRATISMLSTYLGQADLVHTLIFISTVIIINTRFDTYVIFAFTSNSTLQIFLTCVSWISNIFIPQQKLLNSAELCHI